MLNRRRLSLLLVLLAAGAIDNRAADPKKAEPKTEPQQVEAKKSESLMRQKLDFTNRILAGIATEDFDAIGKNAEALQKLTRTKEFDRSKPQEYRAQLLIFDFANSELLRLSKEKSLDGAALAYTQLTLSCVNCHKHLRAP